MSLEPFSSRRREARTTTAVAAVVLLCTRLGWAECVGDANRNLTVSIGEVQQCVNNFLLGCNVMASHVVPSLAVSGQTQCWDSAGALIPCAGTGQDGDIQAGATLHYQDNGDGTITDLTTGLMWEKKDKLDGVIDVFNPHDADNTLDWNGLFFHVFVLNAFTFAGHDDWRAPNMKELESIVDFDRSAPAIDAAFHGASCGALCADLTDPTCSCTNSNGYWTSSTAGNPSTAWLVGFSDGVDFGVLKTGNQYYVRAVRGGF